MRRLGSLLQPLLTASEEREVTQHVYELMGEAGCDDQERGDREGLLREIGDNPRCRGRDSVNSLVAIMITTCFSSKSIKFYISDSARP